VREQRARARATARARDRENKSVGNSISKPPGTK
jgi:hypothetical protein